MAVQPNARDKFSRKDQCGIDGSAKPDGTVFQEAADGSKERHQAVDGKHPERGGAGQPQVAPAKGAECRKDDLQTPSQQTAMNKVL